MIPELFSWLCDDGDNITQEMMGSSSLASFSKDKYLPLGDVLGVVQLQGTTWGHHVGSLGICYHGMPTKWAVSLSMASAALKCLLILAWSWISFGSHAYFLGCNTATPNNNNNNNTSDGKHRHALVWSRQSPFDLGISNMIQQLVSLSPFYRQRKWGTRCLSLEAQGHAGCRYWRHLRNSGC